MASRPVFIPDFSGASLVQEQMIEFKWSSGFSEIQKKKNVKALHKEASEKGISNILEISTKSDEEIGRKLSAFNLKYEVNGELFLLESVYQGSKVFKKGGPFIELFEYEPREAKKFIRDLNCNKLKEYRLLEISYPLSPPNAFYDWLYMRSLTDHADWIKNNMKFEAFTDIEFNPEKQINCQARSFAEYLSLLKRNKLSESLSNFDFFCSMLRII